MKTVNIAGVPEHFNLPWHMAIEEGAFKNRGINLVWEDIPQGTGKMCEMLRNKETDIAIILTEGIVKDILAGNPSKIVQVYVESPLLWGIHVAANSNFTDLHQLNGKKAAISRFGSGSHLMAFVNAQQLDWDVNSIDFELVNTLEGAITALTKGEAHYFMWERFTTKPLVDNGTFRWLGNCPTPWPCFVIAVNNSFLTENKAMVKHILEVINIYTEDFRNIPSIDKTIANRYNQKIEDVKEWLSLTRWGQNPLTAEVVEHVQKTLKSLALIENVEGYKTIVANL